MANDKERRYPQCTGQLPANALTGPDSGKARPKLARSEAGVSIAPFLAFLAVAWLLTVQSIARGETIRGKITYCDDGVPGYEVTAFERSFVGFKLDGPECVILEQPPKTLGTTVTDSAGNFTVAYTPASEPPTACLFYNEQRVIVYDGADLVWNSGWTGATRFDRETSSPGDCTTPCVPDFDRTYTVQGSLSRPCNGTMEPFPQTTVDIIAVFEKLWTGYPTPQPDADTKIEVKVGTVTTKLDGTFSLPFRPADVTPPVNLPWVLITNFLQVYVKVHDTDSSTVVLLDSEKQYVACDTTINFDITMPFCIASSTRVRVEDEFGSGVSGAPVFVNNQLRGHTIGGGYLNIHPPVVSGDILTTRRRVRSVLTDRDIDYDPSQRWTFRVYTTNLPLTYDSSGRNVRFDYYRVQDPAEQQTLRLDPDNTIIALNLRASLQWDATQTEMNTFRDRLLEASQYLYNATDGQFVIGSLKITDDRNYWSEADWRIYADYDLRASVDWPRGKFIKDRSWWCWDWLPKCNSSMRMSRSDANEVYIHEFGHYGFDLKDEYKDDRPDVYCTNLLKNSETSDLYHRDNQQASCMMWQQARAPKICSMHPDNPHDTDLGRGDEDCWSHMVKFYRDSSDPERYRLFTPLDRGVILGEFPVIPFSDWQNLSPFSIVNTDRPDLCEPTQIQAVNSDGTPVEAARVWTHTTYGRWIRQGLTDQNGGLLVTGLHIGDLIRVQRLPLSSPYLGGLIDYYFTDDDCTRPPISSPPAARAQAQPAHALKLQLRPNPFDLRLTVEPVSSDSQEIRIYIRADVPLANAPRVEITPIGEGAAQTVSMAYDPSADAYVASTKKSSAGPKTIEITAFDRMNRQVTRMADVAVVPINAGFETKVNSPDGLFEIEFRAGTFSENTHISIGPALQRPPILDAGCAFISGPFSVAAASSMKGKRLPVIRFKMPMPGGAIPIPYDPNSLEIRRYNPDTGKWDNIGGTYLPDVYLISARIDRLGTYLLTARKLGTLAPADLNSNGSMDHEDLYLLVEKWLRENCQTANNWCAGADINKDGHVNFQDFSISTSYWLCDCPVRW